MDDNGSDNSKSWNRSEFIKALPLALGMPYILRDRRLGTSKLNQEPVPDDFLAKVPQPVIPRRPDLVKLYNKCWKLGYQKSEHGTDQNNFVDWYVDEGFDTRIFQWDTCFALAWAKYSQGAMPNIESLDNFYRNQHKNGAIGGVIRKNGKDNKPTNSPSFTHNNLFSWAEWEHYLVTGDQSRFKYIVPILDRYADWLKEHRTRENGHYWWSGFGSGMDNSPRSKATKSYPPYGWVDYDANEALAAFYLAKMAQVAGYNDIATKYRDRHRTIRQMVNRDMWSEDDRIYWDIDKDGSFMKVKTVASFWPLWGRITAPKHVEGLVSHLNDSQSFNRPHRVPTTAADQKAYVPSGGYWRGSVWAPTNHMIIKGLQANDHHKLARDIVVNHLDNMAAVFAGTKTVWENYSSEFTKAGQPAKADFVGWSGDGPIAQLIENYIGIKVNVPENTIRWDLLTTEEVGLRNIKFGDDIVNLVAGERKHLSEKITINIKAGIPFQLHLNTPRGTFNRQISKGKHKVTF